jgi:D-tyrosyl-tRNA(Tyr) deacylase
MRAVIQRVSRAAVSVDGAVVGAVEMGLLILLGVKVGDTDASARWLAEKIPLLRIFPDDQDRFHRSLLDVGGGALVVSQFTLYGDTVGQRRPSFIQAAPPAVAALLVDSFVIHLKRAGVQRVETGVFGAKMLVELVNDGPVTLILDRDG